jgi:tRNA A-37 threonylcarbamoyl transferase component Bud32
MSELSSDAGPLPPGPLPTPPSSPCTTLGKYRLLATLGQGGNGVVYRAFDTVLHRVVAVKRLSTPLADNPTAAQRLLREARAAAAINHPHIVVVHEVVQLPSELLLVMELLPGGSAEHLLEQRERLPWPEATQIIRDACRGLAAAHATGLIHRDIKPGNILLAADGTAKLADFGLAKNPQHGAALTREGCIVGTPLFMSPEQIRNEPLDERSDVCSLGATYFALLTGRPPYDGEGVALVIAHCSRPVPDPRTFAPDVPEACVAVVQRALAKEPANRFANARELRAALDGLLAAAPAPQVTQMQAAPPVEEAAVPTTRLPAPARAGRPWRRLAAAGAALALVAALLCFALTRRGGQEERVAHNINPRWPDFPVTTGGQIQAVTLSHNPEHPVFAWLLTHSSGQEKSTSRVVVWDWGQGKIRHSISLNYQAAHALALSPDGALLAFGKGAGSIVTVLETATGKQSTLSLNGVGWLRKLTFGPDSRTLAVGAGPTSVALFDASTARLLESRKETAAKDVEIKALAFAGDSRTLALSLSDGRVIVWEKGQKAVKNTLQVDPGHAYSLAFSPAGDRLAGAVAGPKCDPVVLLWDLVTGGRSATLRGHEKEVFAVAYRPDGKALASADIARVWLWDVDRAEPRGQALEGPRGYMIFGLAFTPGGKAMFSGGWDGALRRWDLTAPREP